MKLFEEENTFADTVTMDKKKKGILLGVLAAALLAGLVFFFIFFKVTEVEVIGSTHYTEKEIREMVMKSPLMGNTVLAYLFCKNGQLEEVPFVEGYTLTMLNKNTICISVKEKKSVGCIPYLDSYVYFDRNGIFVESSKNRDKSIPFFDGIQVAKVVMNEKLPIKGNTVLNTAVALSTIFQKNKMVPEHIQFDRSYQISLVYGNVTVMLGTDKLLEDKMTRALAILPKLAGRKGILHLENVTENSKTITFEMDSQEITSEEWTGGYQEDGEFTGDGLYDEYGNYVGEKPMTPLEHALANWHGGYDETGAYTGDGPYDENWNYVGEMPTQEAMDAKGDWTGGYMQDGSYTGYGELDKDGNYVGPNPNKEP